MNLRKLFPILLSATFLFVVSCKKEKDLRFSNDYHPDKGKVTGTVYAKNGTTPIPNATVFVDHIGKIFLTKTDENGDFTLKAPVGDQTLHIQTGGGRIFRTALDVNISKNKTLDLNNNSNSSLKLLQAGKLAYITGAYDEIEVIIEDTLGYNATQIGVSDLDDPSTLAQYDAIFLNCGNSTPLDSAKYHNLEGYVKNGGSLYASDWAVDYLVGDGNYNSVISHGSTGGNGGKGQLAHEHHLSAVSNEKGPCSPIVGGFIPDSDLCTEKEGSSGPVANADVVANDISNYLGKSQIDINYDLGAWEVIHDLQNWEVLIEDKSQYGPLAVRRHLSTNNGGGNGNGNGNGNNGNNGNNTTNDWVTICHIPPGNPSNPQTITISTNALQAHLNHGCYVGTCNGQGGNIYYTTFHNEHNSTLGQDVQKILEYFVLNL